MSEEPVRFLHLGRQTQALRADLLAAITEVVDSGVFLGGPRIERFERDLADFLGGGEVVAVGSGTQALQVLLHAHGIGPGDEVVTTPASFFATARAISMVGATPVFVDVRPDDYNIDPEAVAHVVGPRTRAVLAVHLYGRPVDVLALRTVATEAGIPLLEDAAHAIGASSGGVAAGLLGDGAALSFYPTKNLGALGDAGAVVVRDPEVAAAARSARFLGSAGTRDWFDSPGISGRMDELQAAALSVKLRHLDQEQERRAELVSRYRSALPDAVLLPGPQAGVVDAHHLFVLRHPRRDALAARLAELGVETQVHYRHPLHQQPAYAGGASLPVAEAWGREVLSLPLNAHLTRQEQDRIVAAVLQALDGGGGLT